MALAVPRVHRDAFMDDVREEFLRRRDLNPGDARRWMWRQALGSVLPWLRFGLPRSARLRTLVAPAVGLAVASGVLALLNQDLVIEAVRGLPSAGRVPVARGLNLCAVGFGAAIATQFVGRRSTGVLIALAAATVAWPALWAALAGTSVPLALQPGWAAAVAMAVWVGGGAAQRDAPIPIR